MGYTDAYPGGYGTASVTEPPMAVLHETEDDTWVDITAYLISGDTTRGRQRELDAYQAGTCEILVDNDERTFDPNNTTGPLYGYLKPNRRIQIAAAYDGDGYPIFTGYTDAYIQGREGPRRGTTTIRATDLFKILERADLASSVYAQEVAADSPVAWWRLDEGGGGTAHDAIGDLDLAAIVTAPDDELPLLGEATLVSRDPGSAALIADFNAGLWRRATPVTGPPLTVETIIKYGGSSGGLVTIGQDVPALLVSLSIDTARINGDVDDNSAGNAGSWADPDPIDVDTTHHAAITWASDGTVKLYVDGVEVDSGTVPATGTFPGTTDVMIGGGLARSGGVATSAKGSTWDEIAVYDHALSASRIAAHAAAVTTPWDGDTVDERIQRVVDAVNPDLPVDLDVSSTILQPAELNMSALEHIQKAADSDFGNVYVTADGTLRFENRDATVNQPTLATFSDDPNGDLPIMFSEPSLDDEEIRNDVTVSRLDGIAQRVEDTASIAEYQRLSYTRDGLYHDDDTHSRHAAEWILAEYAQPKERVDQVTINPYRDPALWPAILGRELTDRVMLTETPQNTGDPWTKTLVVEGISHRFGPKTWETTLDLSPAYAEDSCVWELDTGDCGLDEARLFF